MTGASRVCTILYLLFVISDSLINKNCVSHRYLIFLLFWLRYIWLSMSPDLNISVFACHCKKRQKKLRHKSTEELASSMRSWNSLFPKYLKNLHVSVQRGTHTLVLVKHKLRSFLKATCAFAAFAGYSYINRISGMVDAVNCSCLFVCYWYPE